jgi:hypothetical protein
MSWFPDYVLSNRSRINGGRHFDRKIGKPVWLMCVCVTERERERDLMIPGLYMFFSVITVNYPQLL